MLQTVPKVMGQTRSKNERPRVFKIRRRDRVDSSPKPGLRQEWTEYQIVGERGKIIARCGTQEEAEKQLYRICSPTMSKGDESKTASFGK